MAKLSMNARNVLLIVSIILILLPSKSNVESTLKFGLGLTIGLMAPVILLFTAAALLTGFLTGNYDLNDSNLVTFNFNGNSTSIPFNDLVTPRRIKRSTELVQLIGQIPINEEQLLERIFSLQLLDNIFSLDTKKCAEKLLCEVASDQRSHKHLTADEISLFKLFSDKKIATKKSSEAVKVYRKALKYGSKKLNCTVRYPTCPYEKPEMVYLTQLITDSESIENLVPTSSNENLVPTTENLALTSSNENLVPTSSNENLVLTSSNENLVSNTENLVSTTENLVSTTENLVPTSSNENLVPTTENLVPTYSNRTNPAGDDENVEIIDDEILNLITSKKVN